MILDLTIVVLPMPVLWNLQIPMKKELVLSVVFSLGLWYASSHPVVDLPRTLTAHSICAKNVTRVVLIAYSNPNDFTYSLANIGLFAGLEVYIGLITACLATLEPLIGREKLGCRAQRRKAHRLESQSWYPNSSKGPSQRPACD